MNIRRFSGSVASPVAVYDDKDDGQDHAETKSRLDYYSRYIFYCLYRGKKEMHRWTSPAKKGFCIQTTSVATKNLRVKGPLKAKTYVVIIF